MLVEGMERREGEAIQIQIVRKANNKFRSRVRISRNWALVSLSHRYVDWKDYRFIPIRTRLRAQKKNIEKKGKAKIKRW